MWRTTVQQGISQTLKQSIFSNQNQIWESCILILYHSPTSSTMDQFTASITLHLQSNFIFLKKWMISVFLSGSLDGTIKLFESSSNKPLQVFDHNSYIFKVNWSPIRPAVFAAASGNFLCELNLFFRKWRSLYLWFSSQ